MARYIARTCLLDPTFPPLPSKQPDICCPHATVKKKPDSRVRLSIFEGPRSNTAPDGLLPRREQQDGVIGPQPIVHIEASNVGMHFSPQPIPTHQQLTSQ